MRKITVTQHDYSRLVGSGELNLVRYMRDSIKGLLKYDVLIRLKGKRARVEIRGYDRMYMYECPLKDTVIVCEKKEGVA